MAYLPELASGDEAVLWPGGRLDVLPYYAAVAAKLKNIVGNRELATKIWARQGPVRFMVKRASDRPPLYARDLARAATPGLVRARRQTRDPGAAEYALAPAERVAWEYVMPGRLVELFYAANGEAAGLPIGRTVFSLLRGRGTTADDAAAVVRAFAEAVSSDEEARDLFTGDPLVSWTGRSFDVTLLLSSAQPASFYEARLRPTRRGKTLTDRWVSAVSAAVSVPVIGGPARPDHVSIDPSSTPSGQLVRAPLGSLYVTDGLTVAGVSLPVKKLPDRSAVDDLETYTPGRVLRELDELAERLDRHSI